MQPGSKIGKYEVLEKIGQGSFGVVYKGRDPFIKRIVAIKVCSADDEDLRKRFFREAQIVGTLQHRNLVTVYDFGIQDEAPFMVQEYLEGEDLADIIDRKDDLPLEQRLRYLIQVAAGLAFAHEEDVIHRDIKPGNIRVLPEDRVKIMDFGIAKLTSSKTRLTQAGTTIGTAGYLSPEQLQATELDARTDIFSFGVLAYEFLTYERPFRGNTFSKVAYQILYTPPMPLSASWPNCPVELERIISRCLEKRREDRYSNCGEIIADLEKLLEMDKEDATEKLGSDQDASPSPRSVVDDMPVPAFKQPSPEATVAMRLPILPPVRAKDRSTQPASATSQAPPAPQEKPAIPKKDTKPDAGSSPPKTIVLPRRTPPASRSPEEAADVESTPRPPAVDLPDAKTTVLADGPASEEPAPETTPVQILPSIEKALPPSQPPAPTPKPPLPEAAAPAREAKKSPKPEPSRKSALPKAEKKSPAKTDQERKKGREAKAPPESAPMDSVSPLARAREQLGTIPPGLRKAAFAGGAFLLLLVLVIVLWPAGEDDPGQKLAGELEPTPVEIVDETPTVTGDDLGQVRIDSTPWARIVAIESAAGETSQIPLGITTPTQMDLPAGTWIVTLEPGPELEESDSSSLDGVDEIPEIDSSEEVEGRQDDEASELELAAEEPATTRTCRVTVVAGEAVDCRASFGESDPLDYFLEAGWWN